MQETVKWITEEEIENSINTVYVFGDNLQKEGNGGQAKIARKFVEQGKAIGIPTKRKPTNDDDAFFGDRDDEIEAVIKSFDTIRKIRSKGKKIVFFPNIGLGLANLDKRSPQICGMIRGFIKSFLASLDE